MGKEVERKTRPNGELYSSDPSIRARELTEDGKIGGSFGAQGGRPRKPRAAEVLAEKAREHAEEMAETLIAIVNNEDTSAKQKVDTIKMIYDTERKEEALQLDEEVADNKPLSKEDMAKALVSFLREQNEKDEDIVDAQVVEELEDGEA